MGSSIGFLPFIFTAAGSVRISHSLVTFPIANFVTAPAKARLTVRKLDNMSTANNGNDTVGQADIGSGAYGDKDNENYELKSWRTLIGISNAKTRKIRGSNYVQLATVDVNGQPRCRTVVFRGFLNLPEEHKYHNKCDGESCVMRMITDLRSAKVGQVTSHPSNAAEMVWWFPKTTEQYRINGNLIFVGNGNFPDDYDKALTNARKEIWGNISDSARESFFDSNAPGEIYSGDNPHIPIGGRDEDGNLLPPPDNFLLMLLIPQSVDYLCLSNMFRQTDELDALAKDWSSVRLNP